MQNLALHGLDNEREDGDLLQLVVSKQLEGFHVAHEGHEAMNYLRFSFLNKY